MARELYSPSWDKMTWKLQQEYAERKLSYFIRTQLYPYSSFYRKLFDREKIKKEDIRTIKDLRRLPFTHKSDIAPAEDNPKKYLEFVLQPERELILQYVPRGLKLKMSLDRLFKGEEFVNKKIWEEYGPVHVQFTTGRTALPTPFLYAPSDMERMAEAGRRILVLAGYGTRVKYNEARVVDAMPFSPHLAFWMVAYGTDRARVFTLNTGGGRILGTERILAAIESLEATGLTGFPGYVYHLLRTGAEQGRDLSSLKVILIGGERILPGQKKKMLKYLEKMNCKEAQIVGAYGFTEARKGYAECVTEDGESAGYHLYPDLDFLEIVDPQTGEPVGEGEDGELVYSCLEGRGSCVLRFRTGDFVKGGIVYEPCPVCGRTVPRLSSDITRRVRAKEFNLSKVKSTLIDLNAFHPLLSGHPDVEEWQVELRKDGDDPYGLDEVILHIALQEGSDAHEVKQEISSLVQSEMHFRPSRVDFLAKDELIARMGLETGMKESRIVDNRPEK